MSGIDPSRWALLSPLLDELLDLPEAERAQRLAALRAGDATLADELATLLARDAALEDQGFLASGALPPPPGLAGQTVGPYTLERELGAGGMGQVWLARRTDGRYDAQVAIKLLQSGLLGHGDAARFAREGSILARLDQPHIARLLDAGITADGRQPYLVLEYVDGEPIDAYAERHQLSLEARLRLMIDAADAVAHAHARLILHRDLKPSNMLVRRDGQVKLLDFGIAKLLDGEGGGAAGELTQRTGQAFTPLYAAPEQLQGQDVTTATDVYALGVLLYRLLGGGHPTEAETTTPLLRMRGAIEVEPKRLSDQVRRSGAPDAARRARELRGDIDTLVARALKKQPAERYANAAELADDLRRTLAHEPISARPDSWHYRSAKFVRRHRLGVAAAAAALAAVLAGAGVALQEAREARAQREQAEGLIEFMLGDLRKKLQPVGRLDTLDAVGERALAYYAAQDAAGLDADSLARRARALHLIGEIADRRGQRSESQQRFVEAARSTAELLARAPNDTQRIFDHAQSEYWVAYAARRAGRVGEAEAGFQRYRALAQRLLKVEPGKAEWQLEVAYAEQALGVLMFETGRPQPALTTFLQARAVFDQLAPTHEAARSELPSNLGWIAKAQENLGRWPEALDAQRAKTTLLQRRSASDRESQYQLALSQIETARLQLALGRLREAEADAEQASALLTSLVALEPGNREWKVALVSAQVNWSEAIAAAPGRLAEARRVLEAGGPVLAGLQVGSQGVDGRDIAVRARWFAARMHQAGNGAAPVAEMAALLDHTLARPAMLESLSAYRRWALTVMALALGDALQRSGAAEAAQQRWAQGEQVLGRPSAGEPLSTAARAQLRLRLGDAQEARRLADSLQAGPCRHPLVLDLFSRLGRSP